MRVCDPCAALAWKGIARLPMEESHRVRRKWEWRCLLGPALRDTLAAT